MRQRAMHFSHLVSLFVALAFFSAASVAASQTATSAKVMGTYFNEGRNLVELDLISKDGKEGTTIPLSPGRIDRAVITEGRTKIYMPSEGTSARRLLSTSRIPTPKSAREFFDKEQQTFYFRIVAGKVTLVKPGDLTPKERRQLKEYKRELQRAGVYDN